jgi:hypothetical protein
VRWLVTCEAPLGESFNRTYDCDTPEEAFVRWRRFYQFNMGDIREGEIIVSVFPVLPRRTTWEHSFVTSRDFDLVTRSLAIMAIEESLKVIEGD